MRVKIKKAYTFEKTLYTLRLYVPPLRETIKFTKDVIDIDIPENMSALYLLRKLNDINRNIWDMELLIRHYVPAECNIENELATVNKTVKNEKENF